jgi:hypothetical protein
VAPQVECLGDAPLPVAAVSLAPALDFGRVDGDETPSLGE